MYINSSLQYLTQKYREKIPGTMRIGNYWAVPADAERPKDGRIKSGRYIKLKKKQ